MTTPRTRGVPGCLASAFVTSAALGLALAGCHPLPPAVQQDAERYVSLYEGWAEVSATHGDDCGELGAALSAWADAHALELATVEARLGELPPDQAAAFRELYDPRMDAVQPKLEPLFRCLDHPAVKAAVEKI